MYTFSFTSQSSLDSPWLGLTGILRIFIVQERERFELKDIMA
jgi:hypothetical protein